MPSVRGCNLPDDLLYDVDNHIWFTEVGDGTVKLTGDAVGTSFGAGAGNLVLQFTTQAEMAYRITYKYTEIPTPGTAVLLAGAGLAGIRRRR